MTPFFTDPILRAPTLGCMLMCLACSLVGVIVFIRKESLLGETLSHSTYPGMMLGCLGVVLYGGRNYSLWGLIGAAVSCFIALAMLNFALFKVRLKKDSALCFVLSLFFGIGLTLASYLQNFNSLAYKHARIFLLGQAATITDAHLNMYFLFAAFIVVIIVVAYKPIQMTNFDPLFARSVGIWTSSVTLLGYGMLIGAIVIGLRSMGLLLLSGMLIGPAIAARQWTDRLWCMFCIAGVIGMLSGFLGVVFSTVVSNYTSNTFSFATGPTIMLVSASFALSSLILAPKRGWVMRSVRIFKFKIKCNEENILKSLWHIESKNNQGASKLDVFAFQSLSKLHYWILLTYLDFKGDLTRTHPLLTLTDKGRKRAERIVRMHRLWELYLVHIGVGKDRVHHNAEEMEHIITEPIEKELLKLMDHPTKDPHNQPIPGGVLC